jgi:hypothetical protein
MSSTENASSITDEIFVGEYIPPYGTTCSNISASLQLMVVLPDWTVLVASRRKNVKTTIWGGSSTPREENPQRLIYHVGRKRVHKRSIPERRAILLHGERFATSPIDGVGSMSRLHK